VKPEARTAPASLTTAVSGPAGVSIVEYSIIVKLLVVGPGTACPVLKDGGTACG
jgi:hypothetical protein